MLSGGYLSKLVFLTVAIGRKSVRCAEDVKLVRFVGSKPEEHNQLIAFSREIGLLEDGEPFRLKESGKLVAETYSKTNSSKSPFRILLSLFIRAKLPPWAWRIPTGRLETVAALSSNVIDCFRAAGLLEEDPDDEIIRWWKEMESFIRSKMNEDKTETGFKGEILSIQHETARTGRKPKWVSFESNFAGYDLSSFASSQSDKIRLIEVKSSEKPSELATFFVSANEWDVASRHLDSYHFHLWLLSESPILADVPSKEIIQHIPQNQNYGKWQSVEIPFSLFF